MTDTVLIIRLKLIDELNKLCPDSRTDIDGINNCKIFQYNLLRSIINHHLILINLFQGLV